MIGKIIAIDSNIAIVVVDKIEYVEKCVVGQHVMFPVGDFKIVGEILSVNSEEVKISLVGEIYNNKFISGINHNPGINCPCNLIDKEKELPLIIGANGYECKKVYFGKSVIYTDYPVYVNVNDFFSNHFSILGNSGSGKSCSVARIIQNVLQSKDIPFYSNIFLFDVYGEYEKAFSECSKINPNLNFKSYTTNIKDTKSDLIKIPLWLLGPDDFGLLLDATMPSQLLIIEKALRMLTTLNQKDEESLKYKNNVIAAALLEILHSGNNPAQMRDQMVAILSTFNTENLNLDSKIILPGYVRTLRQCLIIDADGKINDIKLITDFFESFRCEDTELKLPDGSFQYTLNDFKEALDFALISEGIFTSDRVYDYANILKVRLQTLMTSETAHFFDVEDYITKDAFIKKLIIKDGSKKAQIINFNINHVTDRFAKVIVKIFSKMLFDFTTRLNPRASFPIHILIEEAHRYIQNDSDNELYGYNIFERIAKEGRKYGVILGIISQRLSEISETAFSQCSNFLILRMVHPKDLQFIRNMVPNVTDEIIERIRTLQPGSAVAFGTAFQLALTIQFDLPNPTPYSNNVDISKTWYIKKDK